MQFLPATIAACSIALFLEFASFASVAAAEVEEVTSEVLSHWVKALNSPSRMSAHFRLEQTNHVFGLRTVRYGTYLRENPRRWLLTLSDGETDAVSALCPSNGNHSRSERLLVLRRDNHYVFGCPDGAFLNHWSSDEFESALNATPPENSWEQIAHELSRAYLLNHTAPLLFPVLLPESPEFESFGCQLINAKRDRTGLSLTPHGDSTLRDLVTRIDAIFESGADLPVAVRIFDSPGTCETRWYVTSLEVNADVEVPNDAFDLPTQIPLLPASPTVRSIQTDPQ